MRYPRFLPIAMLLFGAALSSTAQATLTVTPITWDVIGLDSNRPADGPRNFPVGARVCRSTGSIGTGDVTAVMAFTSTNANIDFRGGTLSSINLGPIAIGSCVDAYYEVTIAGTSAAFNTRVRTPLLRAIPAAVMSAPRRGSCMWSCWSRRTAMRRPTSATRRWPARMRRPPVV